MGTMDRNDRRRRKHFMDAKEDRISKLPNEILCHILSFLPTTFAVRTTLLSKIWKNVWTCVPILDFDDFTALQPFRSWGQNVYEEKVIWYIHFVERVLSLHDKLNIQKCSLKCHEDSPSCHIYLWVSVITTCKVKELIIESSSMRILNLPSSLYTCRTLTVLKIKGNFVMNNPTSACFPCVKTLHLHSVFFPDDASFERLFASCPVVEDLDIQRRHWDGVLNLNIDIPSLKRLSLACYLYGGSKTGGLNRKTRVNAPNLEYLELSDDSLGDYSISNSSSLIEVSVSGTSAFELLKIISHVRVLRLPGNTMKDLFFVDGADSLPIFHNLTRLELGVDSYLGLQLLKCLLGKSPNLEDLIFFEGLVQPTTSKARWIWSPQLVPVDLLLHLKKIEIHKFMGRADEVALVEHLLEHAKELERMMIYVFRKAQNQLVLACDRILKHPRASTSCKLCFL